MIVFSSVFKKEFKRLYKRYNSLRKDLDEIISLLEKDPKHGIDLGYGVRKIRMSITSKNKGKSGGARIISYNYQVEDNGDIVLLTIYDKSERSNISSKEISQLIKQVRDSIGSNI